MGRLEQSEAFDLFFYATGSQTVSRTVRGTLRVQVRVPQAAQGEGEGFEKDSGLVADRHCLPQREEKQKSEALRSRWFAGCQTMASWLVG